MHYFEAATTASRFNLKAKVEKMSSNANPNPISFCVYGSSSKQTKQIYMDASFELGAEIGKKGYICINGGGGFGCMVRV